MYYNSEVRIEDIGSYIKEISRLINVSKGYFRWFRGHSNNDWELVPKIQRNFGGTDEELFRIERYYTNDFQAKASVLKLPKPRIDEYANWLTLMQHYGLKTRLLDWSRSPLIALYFAVSDKNEYQKDACIWLLSPGGLNKSEELESPTYIDGKKYENSFIYNMSHKTVRAMIFTAFRRWEPNCKTITPDDKKFDFQFRRLQNKIVACYPTEADNRVYNQFSTFTVHNSTRKLEEFCDKLTLARIIIPCEIKEQLLNELAICGITQSYIFPDFEHLAAEINKEF